MLSHPRIVKLYDCYHLNDYIYVCMELYVSCRIFASRAVLTCVTKTRRVCNLICRLCGGELFDRVSAVGFFSEDVARRSVQPWPFLAFVL
jgi:hypothetical protein